MMCITATSVSEPELNVVAPARLHKNDAAPCGSGTAILWRQVTNLRAIHFVFTKILIFTENHKEKHTILFYAVSDICKNIFSKLKEVPLHFPVNTNR
jgi:hypothetical protein